MMIIIAMNLAKIILINMIIYASIDAQMALYLTIIFVAIINVIAIMIQQKNAYMLNQEDIISILMIIYIKNVLIPVIYVTGKGI